MITGRPTRRELALKWAAFVEGHHGSLAAYAISLTRNDAEAADCVQEALLGAIRLAEFPLDPLAYLIRAIRNQVIDVQRRQRLADPARIAPRLDRSIDRGQAAADSATLELVLGAADELPPVQREVLLLRLWCRMSFASIGEAMGLPEGTASSHYSRALAATRARLESTTLRETHRE